MGMIVVRNECDAEVARDLLGKSGVIGCDTETSSLNSKSGRLYSIQFSDGLTDVLVPISEGASPYSLLEILRDENIVKVFHNARFDLAFLNSYSYETRNIFCSMIAEKALTRGANQSVSLAETVYRHFGVDLDKSKREIFTKKWDGVWTDELIEYALSDVRFLPRLRAEQVVWMTRLGLLDDYESAVGQIHR